MEVDSMAVYAGARESPASQLDFVQQKLQLLCDGAAINFDAWISLIRDVEEASPNDMQVISLVYDSFLSEFPLCYGYWNKYAAHKARLCTCKEVVEVYERAVQAVTHSVDLWVSYCNFGMLAYEDPADIRRLYERALSLVGKDYLCHHLWDKYIEFEYFRKQWSQLANIYVNTLKFPTKKLHRYYESFKKLVRMLEEEASLCNMEISSEALLCYEATNAEESDHGRISSEISGLFNRQDGHFRPDAVKKYLVAGEHFYQRSSKVDEEISCFEANIKRTYFHTKPLDDHQLENWHQYLDYVEKHGDFDWAVKLYERCLIPCANYSEFWIRYVEFVDANGGREIANFALGRASSFFLKGVPTFRMYYAMFKEQIGDVLGARSLFLQGGGDFASDFTDNINRLANMEKRTGNAEAASKIYETAIENAMEKQNMRMLTDLCTNLAQFKYAASGSINAAKEVFVEGIKRAPCKSMIKGLIQFMGTHGGPAEIPKLDSIIANAITPGSDVSRALRFEDREDISLLFLEFVDLYGGIQELRRAWARHSKLFPQKTRRLSQYRRTESTLQDEDKQKRNESLCSAHDVSVSQISKSEPSSRSNLGEAMQISEKVELQVDVKNIVESAKEHTVIAEEQQMLGGAEVHQEIGNVPRECINNAHNEDVCSDKSKIENKMDITPNLDPSSCELNDRSTYSPQTVNQKSSIAVSNDCNSPSKATAGSKGNDSQDGGKRVGVSTSCDPGRLCSRSNSPSREGLATEGSPSNPVQTSPEVVEKQQLEIQVKLETDSEHDVAINSACSLKFSGMGDLTRCGKEVSEDPDHDHNQVSQPPQSPVHAQHSGSQMTAAQSNTWRSQSMTKIEGHQPPQIPGHDHIQASQHQQMPVHTQHSSSQMMTTQGQGQQIPQAHGQHQMTGAQVYPSGNLAWAGQAIQQQQSYMYAQAQIGTTHSQAQAQAQLFSQPLQGNQPYGSFQNMQGYAQQVWQYYQQQLYYLQLELNQQMQGLQQQQPQYEQLQQKYMQQQQLLYQQMLLWQQQLQQQQQQQQQQQASQVQEKNDKQQGQHHPSSPDTKHEQQNNQHQESQMEHQSQHFQQQQQQQLYLQQQQQMYIMQQQQQQLYQQHQLLHQQLMQQQQHHSQLSQQQQQELVQQQQLFQQQQQQQLLLLQQQQQQFLQLQQQQQTNQEDLQATNYNLNSQHARNQQPERGQETEVSQIEGSKVQNGEWPSSYPSTPQSQSSNQ